MHEASLVLWHFSLERIALVQQRLDHLRPVHATRCRSFSLVELFREPHAVHLGQGLTRLFPRQFLIIRRSPDREYL